MTPAERTMVINKMLDEHKAELERLTDDELLGQARMLAMLKNATADEWGRLMDLAERQRKGA